MLVINKGRHVSGFVKYKNRQPRIVIAILPTRAKPDATRGKLSNTLGPLLTETSLACRYRGKLLLLDPNERLD